MSVCRPEDFGAIGYVKMVAFSYCLGDLSLHIFEKGLLARLHTCHNFFFETAIVLFVYCISFSVTEKQGS